MSSQDLSFCWQWTQSLSLFVLLCCVSMHLSAWRQCPVSAHTAHAVNVPPCLCGLELCARSHLCMQPLGPPQVLINASSTTISNSFIIFSALRGLRGGCVAICNLSYSFSLFQWGILLWFPSSNVIIGSRSFPVKIYTFSEKALYMWEKWMLLMFFWCLWVHIHTMNEVTLTHYTWMCPKIACMWVLSNSNQSYLLWKTN